MSIANEISRLQTAKADLKTAIEGKGVTVAASATLDAYADLVDAIETGGGGGDTGDWRGATKYMQNVKFKSVSGLTYPEHIQVDLSNANNLDSAFNINTWADVGLRKITLTPPTTTTAFTCQNAFAAVRVGLTEIVFTATLAHVNNARQMFQNCSVLTSITGNIDLSSCPSAWALQSAFQGCSALENVSFIADCINYSVSFADCSALTNESLASIANALNSSVTSQTLTLHSTPKGALSDIMGSVTGGVFEIDASGATSLQDFVTNTKGWTIA